MDIGSIDIRTMPTIILSGSFSTEFDEDAPFFKFQDYATINQIFISWQTENCVPTPDHTGGLNLFFWFIAVASREKKKRERERKVVVASGPAKRNVKRKKKAERVGPRAAGLMSLIMEKYIKWHPLYFLKERPSFRFYSFLALPHLLRLRNILIFMSAPAIFY